MWEFKEQYFESINIYGKSINNYVIVVKDIDKFINIVVNDKLYTDDVICKLIDIEDNNFTINIIFSEIYNSKNPVQSVSWIPFTKANKIKQYKTDIINFIIYMIDLNEHLKNRSKGADILTFKSVNVITDFRKFRAFY